MDCVPEEHKQRRFCAKLGGLDDDDGPGSEHPCIVHLPSAQPFSELSFTDKFHNDQEIQAGISLRGRMPSSGQSRGEWGEWRIAGEHSIVKESDTVPHMYVQRQTKRPHEHMSLPPPEYMYSSGSHRYNTCTHLCLCLCASNKQSVKRAGRGISYTGRAQ